MGKHETDNKPLENVAQTARGTKRTELPESGKIEDKEFKRICESDGNFSMVSEITDEQAKSLANYRNTKYDFSGLKKISEKQAYLISKANCDILEIGIDENTDENTIAYLTGQKEVDPDGKPIEPGTKYYHLTLNNFSHSTEKSAEILGKFNGYLNLPAIKNFSENEEQAKKIASLLGNSENSENGENSKGLIGLTLDGLEQIGEESRLLNSREIVTSLASLKNAARPGDFAKSRDIYLPNLVLSDNQLKDFIDIYKGQSSPQRCKKFGAGSLTLGIPEMTDNRAEILSEFKGQTFNLVTPNLTVNQIDKLLEIKKSEDGNDKTIADVIHNYVVLIISGIENIEITYDQIKEFKKRGWTLKTNDGIGLTEHKDIQDLREALGNNDKIKIYAKEEVMYNNNGCRIIKYGEIKEKEKKPSKLFFIFKGKIICVADEIIVETNSLFLTKKNDRYTVYVIRNGNIEFDGEYDHFQPYEGGFNMSGKNGSKEYPYNKYR